MIWAWLSLLLRLGLFSYINITVKYSHAFSYCSDLYNPSCDLVCPWVLLLGFIGFRWYVWNCLIQLLLIMLTFFLDCTITWSLHWHFLNAAMIMLPSLPPCPFFAPIPISCNTCKVDFNRSVLMFEMKILINFSRISCFYTYKDLWKFFLSVADWHKEDISCIYFLWDNAI